MCNRQPNPDLDRVHAQLISKAGNLFLDMATIAIQKSLTEDNLSKQEPIIDAEYENVFDQIALLFKE